MVPTLQTTTMPHISVLIPTCNRPDDLRRCLESLRAVRYPSWDIVLVDQSDDVRTQSIADAFSEFLPTLVHRRMQGKGASRARNLGVGISWGEILALLDDDCTVEPDWLEQVANAFARHPHAALVIGRVTSAPHDPRLCFIPVSDVRTEHVLCGLGGFLDAESMGASYYLRRAATERVGPFDVCFGPGAPFFMNCEDIDYVYRLLGSGCTVIKTPSIVVQHYGSRDYQSGAVSRLFRVSAYAFGAVDMKLLRSGNPAALVVIIARLWSYVGRINVRRMFLRQRPNGIAWIVMYARGLFAGCRFRLDRRLGTFMYAMHQPAD
jgi:GT2 family glycosyltransferase